MCKGRIERKYPQSLNKTTKIEDFQLQKTIVMTTFGRIILVERENQLMLLKIMKKENIISTRSSHTRFIREINFTSR